VENGVPDFCMEVPGQVMKIIWNFWDYTGDEAFLRETAYPPCGTSPYFTRRSRAAAGTEGYGISYQMKYTRNNTGAITLFRKILNLAAEAAEFLGVDAGLIPGWRDVAAHLPPYPLFRVEGGDVIGANEMAFPRYTRGDHFMFNGYNPVNLSDEINLDSPEELKTLMIRTADVLMCGKNADPYILLDVSKDHIPPRYAYGSQKIESYAMLAQNIVDWPERLMNSRSGRIYLFPSTPDWTVATFRGFLAQGGFEVSAMRDESGVTAVVVKARRSIPLRLMNSWPGRNPAVTDTGTGKAVAYTMDTTSGACIVMNAEAGHSYSVDL
jgi:hypothetical protein